MCYDVKEGFVSFKPLEIKILRILKLQALVVGFCKNRINLSLLNEELLFDLIEEFYIFLPK